MMNNSDGWMGGGMGGWMGSGVWFWPIGCLLAVAAIVFIVIKLAKK